MLLYRVLNIYSKIKDMNIKILDIFYKTIKILHIYNKTKKIYQIQQSLPYQLYSQDR